MACMLVTSMLLYKYQIQWFTHSDIFTRWWWQALYIVATAALVETDIGEAARHRAPGDYIFSAVALCTSSMWISLCQWPQDNLRRQCIKETKFLYFLFCTPYRMDDMLKGWRASPYLHLLPRSWDGNGNTTGLFWSQLTLNDSGQADTSGKGA